MKSMILGRLLFSNKTHTYTNIFSSDTALNTKLAEYYIVSVR